MLAALCFLSPRLYSEEELPPEFKLFIPTATSAPASRAGKAASAGDNIEPMVEENMEVLAVDGEHEIEETEKDLSVLTDPATAKTSVSSPVDVAVSS